MIKKREVKGGRFDLRLAIKVTSAEVWDTIQLIAVKYGFRWERGMTYLPNWHGKDTIFLSLEGTRRQLTYCTTPLEDLLTRRRDDDWYSSVKILELNNLEQTLKNIFGDPI